MNTDIAETLTAFNKSLSETQARRMALINALGELVGSRITVSGYPDTVHMNIRDHKSWQIVKRLAVPAYSLAEKTEEVSMEPRDIENGVLDSADDRKIKVSFIRPDNYEPTLHEATGYSYRLEQIVSLSLLQDN